VHITEREGPYPGTGAYDYKPVLTVLRRRGYTGWLSVEVFDFSTGADKIARESLKVRTIGDRQARPGGSADAQPAGGGL